MSREAARAFIDRMKTDETLRKEVLAQEDSDIFVFLRQT